MSRVFNPSQAHKLEDPARLTWLPPSEVVATLAVHAGMNVADVGAGTGYFSIPLANAVGATGHVFAVDLQREMLDLLSQKLAASGTGQNISLHRGEAAHVPLREASVDLAFFANVWHELDDASAVLEEARRILRPSGRIAILDWRRDMSPPPGPPQDHRISSEDVQRFLTANDCRVISSQNMGQFSYLLIAAV